MCDPICDQCTRKCVKTPIGHYAIICKEEKVLCMSCYENRLRRQEFFYKHGNVLEYLYKRSIKK